MILVSVELAAFAREARRLGLVPSAKALEHAADLAASSERERPTERSRPANIPKNEETLNG